MKETILRDGEIAILIGDVTVIMNLNTVLMAVAMLLPALDKPEKPQEAPTPHGSNPAPKVAPCQVSPVKNIVPSPICTGKNPNSPTVFVDNFGNVFATATEAEIQHNMAYGAGYALKSGKQVLGYGYPRHHHLGLYRTTPDRELRYRPIKGVPDGDNDFRLVYLVEVPKRFLYNGDPKDCNARYLKSIQEAHDAIKESIGAGLVHMPDPGFTKFAIPKVK